VRAGAVGSTADGLRCRSFAIAARPTSAEALAMSRAMSNDVKLPVQQQQQQRRRPPHQLQHHQLASSRGQCAADDADCISSDCAAAK